MSRQSRQEQIDWAAEQAKGEAELEERRRTGNWGTDDGSGMEYRILIVIAMLICAGLCALFAVGGDAVPVATPAGIIGAGIWLLL